ncbi:blr4344 [Bradyrhizobium diazoefficiens USDA 110]|uniref:Blr4344 protein n=1 Tax=Bradyrhizobium diazoefficiens (strain JCM 10833 / BCRC 13528 / IAM 13628 / NBRC 14792 / USDA 110) TaxID=224911 RepID=Q89M49_BRADU|nr:blr4344 [Bradyrhizobium diazoefficiens USDA 110]
MTQATPASSTPKPRRPRPQVMRLTDAAAQRISELTQRADSEIVGLRVGVKNGGCAGQSYTVEYAHDVRPTDEVVEDKGVKILVDPKAVLFLLGHRDGLQGRQDAGPVRLQQPQPGLRLRLRRIGRAAAGEDRRVGPALPFHSAVVLAKARTHTA